MIKILFLSALLLAKSGIVKANVRHLQVNDEQVPNIHLKMGRSTVIRFREKPQKVIVGNQNYFSIEFVGNDVTIQPQAMVTSNLFVYGKHRVYGFLLKVGDDAKQGKPPSPILHVSIFITHFQSSPSENLVLLQKLFLDWGLSSSQIEELTDLAWPKSTIKTVLSKYHIKREKAKRLTSHPKYGQKIVAGFRVPHRGEQATLQKMLKLRKAGHTFQKRANALNGQGLTNRSDGKWLPRFVATLIKRNL